MARDAILKFGWVKDNIREVIILKSFYNCLPKHHQWFIMHSVTLCLSPHCLPAIHFFLLSFFLPFFVSFFSFCFCMIFICFPCCWIPGWWVMSSKHSVKEMSRVADAISCPVLEVHVCRSIESINPICPSSRGIQGHAVRGISEYCLQIIIYPIIQQAILHNCTGFASNGDFISRMSHFVYYRRG